MQQASKTSEKMFSLPSAPQHPQSNFLRFENYRRQQIIMSASSHSDMDSGPVHNHNSLYNGKRVLLLFDMDNTLTPASDVIQDTQVQTLKDLKA